MSGILEQTNVFKSLFVGCLECRVWYRRWRSSKADLNLDQFNIRVIEPVGFGPFRKVYRCHDVNSNRVVAVKEVYAGDGSETEMINERIEFLKDQPHNNVVRLLYTLKRGCYLYLVFEYITPNLYYFINLSEDLRYPKQRNYMLYQMLAAVAHYHSNGILLRDLKPQNLLMDFRDGFLKLCDFGLYSSFGDPEPCDIPVSLYTAPEVLLDNNEHSRPSDLWAVGCIFGEIVIKKPLFHIGKSNQDQLRGIFGLLGTPTEESWPGISDLCPTLAFYPKFEPLNLSSKFPDLEPEGVDILSKLLCLDPKKRISAEAALDHAFFNNDLCKTLMSKRKRIQDVAEPRGTKKIELGDKRKPIRDVAGPSGTKKIELGYSTD
ncbi:cell division control protein 2 homolog isoform X1 [Prosopis cineraria]|nr:cell division control protein 2 homolog isoform X1 [Prosopis cineraria]